MKRSLIWIMTVVLSMLMIITFSIAGCKKAEEAVAPAEEEAAKEAEGEAEPVAISGKLEIFTHWTHGGEAEAKEALFKVYNEKFPDVEIIDAVIAGGAGFNARAVLATRLQGGDPPDTFQDMAGGGFNNAWAATGLLEPITYLFEENDWFDVYNEDVTDILFFDDEIWLVPVNVHRVNVLWYNKQIFEENSLQVPKTLDEFFAVAERLEELGITPLSLGDKEIWVTTTLFETILLSVLEADDYKGLFDGSVRWDSPKAKEAVETFVKVLDYVNTDHSALGWDEAMDLVINGKAACNVMGDWAEGYLLAKGLTPDKEFGWIPVPGTDGIFDAVSDGFCVPLNVENKTAAIEWLKVVGSIEGQDAFNPIKGSIPPRTGCNVNLYDAYLQSSIEDYTSDDIVPSLAHCAAISNPWLSDIDDVLTKLIGDKNVDAAVLALQNACDNNLK